MIKESRQNASAASRSRASSIPRILAWQARNANWLSKLRSDDSQDPELREEETAAADPHVRVGVDERGGVCWEVVGPDEVVRCWSGSRAPEILEKMLRRLGKTIKRESDGPTYPTD